MCFEMINHVDYVAEPDVKTKFEIIDAGGPKPSDREMLNHLKAAAKIWISNQIVLKAIATAEEFGRIQPVASAGDIPEMWERGVLFIGYALRRYLIGDIAHPEVTWADHQIQLENRAIMLQLKDFSFVAQMSFGEMRDDAEPMGENVLFRREARLKFGLESEQGIIYQLPEDWLQVENDKARMARV